MLFTISKECSRTLMVVYVVVFWRNKSVDFILRVEAQRDVFYYNRITFCWQELSCNHVRNRGITSGGGLKADDVYDWQIYHLYLSIVYKFWEPKPSVSRDSSVGIATRYGLEVPGIESRWDEIFRTYTDRLRGPPSLPYNGYRVFPGGKGGRGVMLTTHSLLVLRLRKSWAIPPHTLWVLLGLLWGSLYLLQPSVILRASALL
jgi:hypothetical protein